ncbi:ABC-type multidrug transport system, ATPase and permease component [Pseudobutyrivibrio sp. NOR37]|uniref:ABC transporter ATP-binding protein n=1 Tax=Pseudobutyrivibrio xylanivorans TaxID=185007 RepID=A0A6M0LEZ6_PSEXY|nr:ABC transporter ATP-binding protein [Pseudobutyrivibrio xylanivorans]SFR64568.1 ABC-type multidrug transport system, ATPase and permease component [Pseudobutyrivibrio sp. NOR37]
MKILGKFLLRRKKGLLLLVFCSIVVVALSLLNTSYIARVTDDTYRVTNGSISKNVYLSGLTDATIIMVIIMLVMAIANIASGYFAGKISVSVAEDIRNAIYEKALTFSLKEMNDISIPSMITRSTGDVISIQNALYLTLTTALSVPFLIVGGILGVLSLGKALLALLILGVVLVISIFIALVIKLGPLYASFMSLIDGLNKVTREGLSGIQILRALNREKWNSKRIQQTSQQIKDISLSVDIAQAVMQPTMYLVINIIDILAIWVCYYFSDKGFFEIGDIVAFINYLFMTLSGIIVGAMVGIQLPSSFICMSRISEVLEKELSIKDGKEEDVSNLSNYDVCFDNVSFRYSDDAGFVVRDISFTAKQGELTVITGNTGCGKTTLMQLIPRLYDATKGTITIGGVDVKKMKLNDLRSFIGYVPQRVFLHTGDVRFNISYRDKDYNDETILESAELSQSLSFIDEKEKRFEEWISQGGSNFSGGQKQRLTIARALSGSPKVLILDDSASALDLETGVKLRDALLSIVGDISIIFITQRLSIIKNADKVVLMKDGEICEQGTYEELSEHSDTFREILQSQMGA